MGTSADIGTRTTRRRPDDTGGVWIATGVVLGALFYAGIVVMAIAGFTVVVPLVVIPPVMIALIAANSLLGGGRGSGRPTGRPTANPKAPHPSGEPNGRVERGAVRPAGGPGVGEAGGPQ